MTKEEHIDGYLRISEENGLGFTRDEISGLWEEGGMAFGKLHKVYEAYCEAFGFKAMDLATFRENIQQDFVTSYLLGSGFEPWTKLFLDVIVGDIPEFLCDSEEEAHD